MSQPQILIHEMSFNLPTGKALFNKLNLVFSPYKTGLLGNNGIGKSTLMKLVIGELCPHSGYIQLDGTIAYLPQDPPISSKVTVAGFLGCEEKINALDRIFQGSVNECDFNILNEDWEIKDRIQKQLTEFGLNTISLNRPLTGLSGGEVTRLMLSKVFFSDADFLLLDEPTNHLDATARQQLYHAIKQWPRGILVISHDRTLLNLMEDIVEFTTLGAYRFGGNYDAYQQEKNLLTEAKQKQLLDAKKLLNKTKRSIQLTKEKHEQRQAQGRALRRSGSQAKIILDAKENDAYRSLAQFLFRNTTALKLAKDLSGGEKLRALLACVLMAKHPPQLLILDEPTNHLDIHSIQSIESALKHYQGAMIVISHDATFLKNIGIEKIIYAPFK